jgi:dipeptidyl aminopeptidase/acylaminoacyl peptidase
VGVEQAREVVEALGKAGVDFKYDEINGADHLFDYKEEEELEPFYDFLKSRL